MFILGHLGIGAQLSKPFRKGLELKWVFLGTLLPDLIDKPLFYWIGRPFEINWISGTRTIGHTLVFNISIFLAAWILRSKPMAALSVGLATHLTLDLLLDAYGMILAVFYPFLGFQFPTYPFHDAVEHVRSVFRKEILISEGIGALLLAHLFRKRIR